jgi:hypothetical protein
MSLLVDDGCGWGGKHAKVKIEGANVHVCYVNPLYGAKPNIIFDKKTELSRKIFLKKYGINNQGITLKRLKIERR